MKKHYRYSRITGRELSEEEISSEAGTITMVIILTIAVLIFIGIAVYGISK